MARAPASSGGRRRGLGRPQPDELARPVGGVTPLRGAELEEDLALLALRALGERPVQGGAVHLVAPVLPELLGFGHRMFTVLIPNSTWADAAAGGRIETWETRPGVRFTRIWGASPGVRVPRSRAPARRPAR